MKAVIYESNAGSARRYAEMLASKLGVPAYSYKEAVKAIPGTRRQYSSGGFSRTRYRDSPGLRSAGTLFAQAQSA